MAAKSPLHDWVCDGCGRKVYGRRAIPRRCHGLPMRPMGSPWVEAADAFCAQVEKHPGWASALPDDYWISAKVIARLEEIRVDDPSKRWQSSVRAPGGPTYVATYQELWT